MLGLFQNIFHPLGAFLEEHGVPARIYDDDIELGDKLSYSFLDAHLSANVGIGRGFKGDEFEAFVALLRQGYSLSNPVTPSSSILGSLPTLSAQLLRRVEGIDLICFGLYFFARGMRLDSPEEVSDYGQGFGNWRHEQVGFLRSYQRFADVPDLMREAATLLYEVKYTELSDGARAFRCQAIGQKIDRATQLLLELRQLFVLVGDHSQEARKRREQHPILAAAKEKLSCFSVPGFGICTRGYTVLLARDTVLSDIDHLLRGCDKQRQTLRQLQGETQVAGVRADVQALTTVGVLSSPAAPSQAASTCRRRHVASGSADSAPPTQRISVR